MPINTRHPDYRRWEADWTMCTDFASGTREVKARGRLYLPVPTGLDSEGYSAYKDRSAFLNAMGRTVSGLTGAMTRVGASADLSEPMHYLLDNCTGAGHTLQEYIRQILRRILTTSRCGTFVDPDNGMPSLPRMIPYTEANITNWELLGGEPILVVLRSIEVTADPKDRYTLIESEIYQELYLEDGVYTYRYWRPDNVKSTEPVYKAGPAVQPKDSSGNHLNYIPFVFHSPEGVDASPVKPILLDLCYINRSHYINSADLEHGRHMVSLPTPWISGVNPSDYSGGLKIGASKAWILSNADAKVGMLEFTGKGLGHLAEAIDEKQQQMALMGAKLLQPQRKQVESAELARMANAGDASILMGAALAVGEGIDKALDMARKMRGVSKVQSVVMNTDFVDIKLSPEEMEILLQYYQSGVYSEEEFLSALSLGERFKGDIKEAVGRLEAAKQEAKDNAIREKQESTAVNQLPSSGAVTGQES